MFCLFLRDRVYEQGSIDNHLKYLQDYSGTPDFFDAFHTTEDAIASAVQIPSWRFVMTDDQYKVVAYIGKKES